MTIDAGVAVPKHARREVLAEAEGWGHTVIHDEETARLLHDIVHKGNKPVNAEVEYRSMFGDPRGSGVENADKVVVTWSTPVITTFDPNEERWFEGKKGNSSQFSAGGYVRSHGTQQQWADFFAQRQGWFR